MRLPGRGLVTLMVVSLRDTRIDAATSSGKEGRVPEEEQGMDVTLGGTAPNKQLHSSTV